MGHEIGHVTARHTAQRYSQAMLANIGMMGVAIATGSGALANLAGSGAQLYLQSYSRDQEFEADTLGVRYISRATYEPQAMASFLGSLAADSRLDAELRSEEHTSELQSLMRITYAVFCLKKTHTKTTYTDHKTQNIHH